MITPLSGSKFQTVENISSIEHGKFRYDILSSTTRIDMKASTLDKMVVHKFVEINKLCIDKWYDFPKTERESIKRR